MIKANDIFRFLDTLAPFDTRFSWDNAGLLVGDADAVVEKIGLCLDITPAVVAQAESQGVSLIVSHHPVIFSPIKKVLAGSVVYDLIRHGITAICAHTNLDMAAGGVNDTLANKLGLSDLRPLADDESPLPLARIGKLDHAYAPRELAEKVKRDLACGGVRFVEGGSPIETVALCGGAGADLLIAAKAAGAHALITGEAKHHELLLAKEMGITLIDGGHFCTEHGVVYTLHEKLTAAFPTCSIVIFDEPEPASYV